jgi:hypothetical protein
METNEIIRWTGAGWKQSGKGGSRSTTTTDVFGDFKKTFPEVGIAADLITISGTPSCMARGVVYFKDALPVTNLEPSSLAYSGKKLGINGAYSVYDAAFIATQPLETGYTWDTLSLDLAQRRLSLATTFQSLKENWKNTRGPTSSITQLVLHASYQRIIGLGLEVVPHILAELSKETDHWFWALKSITGEDPVPDDAGGDLSRMTTAWLDWGRDRSYI